ncbi:HlyD family efflux transporter periplasmic adaptor subunit [Candidatus Kaiserbacteria bacterium]|nr:HlyD family efflux transporter periplasmic adaptor subunit [Candidatus Kaiserbacteria bacterium]
MIQKLYSWYGKRNVRLVAFTIFILAIVAVFSFFRESNSIEEVQTDIKQVKVSTVSSLSSGSSLNFIGTVEAITQASLEAEASGRVVSVPVSIGQNVPAGTIIAQLENAAQRASVLQAEGAYEAALANSEQNSSGVRSSEIALLEAQNASLAMANNAYATLNNILLTQIDQFFSGPETSLPGLRISGKGNTAHLRNERIAFQSLLPEFKKKLDMSNTESDLPGLLSEAETLLLRQQAMLDVFIEITSNEDTSVLEGVSVASYTTSLIADRSTLNSLIQSVRTAKSNLSNAEEALVRANIAATNGTISVSSAQVKQALGTLRAAEAQLNKTIIRTPIAGTINSLQVKAGDYISQSAPVAEVANNNAQEISIFVGEQDLMSIAIGDEVVINETQKGIVTNVAPAVDPITLKSEVKIATESSDLTTGNTASVSLNKEVLLEKPESPILIPITAVKFSATDGSIFTISEEGVLVSRSVQVGPIVGGNVTITSGVNKEDVIVVDARGLVAGQKVEAINNN